MGTYKTPGIYIVEKNAFPNSVVEVATAIPAFVGYTAKAVNGPRSLRNTPFKISSMSEFETYFGGAPTPVFSMTEDNVNNQFSLNGKKYSLSSTNNHYSLHRNMNMFFANGGGPCYIVSIGDYTDAITEKAFENGIDTLKEEQEPTLLVIPEAVTTSFSSTLQQYMINHCAVMQSCVAILDVADDKNLSLKEISDKFRNGVDSNLSYGVAYLPYLQSSVLSEQDITYLNLDENSLQQCIKTLETSAIQVPGTGATENEMKNFHNLLYQNCALYKAAVTNIRSILNQVPPSAVMAGIYTMIDNSRGVWKAPANVSINQTISLSRTLTNAEQDELNVPINGKSINAIRYFTGEGIKVWGARTLDGNSLDWRYINVRRTMIFLEQSIKNASRAYVFEPNVAATWLNMKSMIENFLRGVWKRGGLAGSSPEDAFEVHVGLGDTMTAEDILEGYLRMTVLVAISHPAEFIEITFQQQMQKS
jgi:uncharacterized protein